MGSDYRKKSEDARGTSIRLTQIYNQKWPSDPGFQAVTTERWPITLKIPTLRTMTSILTGSKLDTGAPPQGETAAGKPRRVGIEIEFGGLHLTDAVSLVVSVFGGTAEEQRHNSWQVLGSEIGDVTVEIDAEILQGKIRGAAEPETEDRLAGFLHNVEDRAYRVAGEISSSVVPVEVVTPPLLFDDIEKLDKLISVLRKAGAEGTEASALNGFGLHLNPEAVELDTPYLTRLLRAFFLLEDILWEDAEVNITRTLMPFISKFPKKYKGTVIDPEYNPDLNTLIDDYLQANPTRNRDLDMLPMFAEIDANKLAKNIDDTLVKARPAFHYRLPDCRLEDPDWGVEKEWRHWVCVEVLSENRDMLDDLCHAYAREARKLTMRNWPSQVQEIIRA